MDFKEMSKKELRQYIRSQEETREKLLEKSNNSTNVEDVRATGEEMKQCNDEIRKAQDEIYSREDETEERSANGFNPNAVFTTRQAFSMNGGANEFATNSVENLALRSNETMVSRVNNKEKLDLGKYVRGMVTGNWDNAEAEKRSYTTSATGVVIPQILSAQIIDQARNVSLFTSAGVPVIPMEEGNTKIARVKKDPTFKFKEEGKEVSESNDFELDSIDLKAKTIYGIAYCSLEAIQSSKNLTDIILQAFSRAMADGIDKGMLYGQGTDKFAPAGLMNDDKINSIEATNQCYSDIVKAIGAVRRANGNPTTLGINADTEEIYSLLVDNNNQPLQMPKAVESLTQIVSNQLAYDEAKGSDALVFDPMAMVVGIQNDVRIRLITDSDECLKKGLVAFQLYSMVDSAAVRPTHISKITGIKEQTNTIVA